MLCAILLFCLMTFFVPHCVFKPPILWIYFAVENFSLSNWNNAICRTDLLVQDAWNWLLWMKKINRKIRDCCCKNIRGIDQNDQCVRIKAAYTSRLYFSNGCFVIDMWLWYFLSQWIWNGNYVLAVYRKKYSRDIFSQWSWI